MTPAIDAGTTERASIVGRSIEEADTPALWIDLDALDHNIATMAGRAAEAGVDWRPHVKASKSPDLARRLVATGAMTAFSPTDLKSLRVLTREAMKRAGAGLIGRRRGLTGSDERGRRQTAFGEP